MSKYLFFSRLFDGMGGICSGDFKETTVGGPISGNFFSINKLEHRRLDKNVVTYRNFLFEMDTIDLETQEEIWTKLGAPITSLVYSGGKSYHAIVSLERPVERGGDAEAGIGRYKAIWERMRDCMDDKIEAMGYECPGESFFDSACKNPSRLSRVPGKRRENGNLQKLKFLGKRVSFEKFESFYDFNYFAEEPKKYFENLSLDVQADTVREFWQLCPTGLKNTLRYVDWADSAGMYPKLLQLTYWAIDSTGVPKDILLEALWEKTFPKLLESGYPKQKLTTAIDHAYNSKRRS